MKDLVLSAGHCTLVNELIKQNLSRSLNSPIPRFIPYNQSTIIIIYLVFFFLYNIISFLFAFVSIHCASVSLFSTLLPHALNHPLPFSVHLGTLKRMGNTLLLDTECLYSNQYSMLTLLCLALKRGEMKYFFIA